MTTVTKAWAANVKGAKLELRDVELPALAPTQVELDMMLCGLCHTDLHMINDDWKISDYPLVAGHEGIGTVAKKGAKVKFLSIGDVVGVGWIRDSCGGCRACRAGEDNMCLTGFQGTMLGPRSGARGRVASNLHGCFSQKMRVEERFAFRIPMGLSAAGAAPLMCAGITTWEPVLRYVAPGARVGVVGLGGLGHMAVKLARAVGAAEVWVFSRSPGKRERARALGASRFVDTRSAVEMAKAESMLDVVIDTSPVVDNPDVETVMKTLVCGGTFCKVGMPKTGERFSYDLLDLVGTGKRIAGSLVSGSKNTNKLLELAAARKLESDVQVIPFDRINEALEMLDKGANKEFRIVLKWSD